MISPAIDFALREVAGSILIIDAHGFIEHASPDLASLLEADGRTLVGCHLSGFVAEGRGKVDALLKRFAASGDWLVGSLTLRSKDSFIDFPCQGKVIQRSAEHGAQLLAIRRFTQQEFSALDRKIDELHAEARRRQETEYRLHLANFAINHASDAMFWIDPSGSIELANEQAALHTGFSTEELMGMSVHRLDPGYPPAIWPEHWENLKRNGHLLFETIHVRKDGRQIPAEVSATYLRFQGKEINFAVVRDISERKQAEKTLRKLNRSLRLLSACNALLIHSSSEQQLLDDICRLVVEIGDYCLASVSYVFHGGSTRPASSYCFSGKLLPQLDPLCLHMLGNPSEEQTAPTIGDYRIQRSVEPPEGRRQCARPCYGSIIVLPLRENKDIFGTLTIFAEEDDAFSEEEIKLLEELANDLAFGVSNQRSRLRRESAEQRLDFLAYHDPLTRLPNRLLLRDRFEQASANATRSGSGLALLFLDLDNFKQINDSLGHDMGDRVLVQIVERLKSCVRESDTISRHGGDEFIVLLPGVVEPAPVSSIAQKILTAFEEPLEFENCVLNLSFSIGISMFPGDGRDFESVLKKADTAVYHAKDSGRNTYRFFTEQMNQAADEQMRYQGQLRNALRNKEFRLHYQPQIDLRTGKVIGCEALIRWQHPAEGMISPAKFIPVAEQSGQIVQIGEWVLEEACRQASLWRSEGIPELVVAVNLSALQFKRGNVIETVATALERHSLPPENLELELTESLLLQDVESTVATVAELKRMGVKLSIDDFGTGYSSLSYLKRLAVDRLKIDQSFVRDLANDPKGAIVHAIVRLGQTLQLCVIAEGVESTRELQILHDFGCHEVQGYLFSPPLPPDEFSRWLLANG